MNTVKDDMRTQAAPNVNTKANPPRSAAQRILLFVGTIGPIGYLPASGTVAVAVAGVPLAWLMRTHFSTTQYIIATLLFTIASVILHDIGDRILGEKDSRKLVWDELAGYWFAVMVAPLTWQIFAIAFFLERFIDIAKIPPANIVEQKVRGGLGVVGDDLIAGLYTMLLLWLICSYAPQGWWGG
jgi:phosphatidylglycerophosphatase A